MGMSDFFIADHLRKIQGESKFKPPICKNCGTRHWTYEICPMNEFQEKELKK